MVFFIILMIVLYYGFSWSVYAYHAKELDRINWDLGVSLLSFFGLGIFWIVPFAIKKFLQREAKPDPYKIEVCHESVGKEPGIQFVKESYYNYTIVYYNIPDEGYSAKINVDIKTVDTRVMDMIIDKLKAWGSQENVKLARIRAYKTGVL